MEKLPFEEKDQIRTFSKDTDSEELKWHRDNEDRLVTPTRPNDWLFQRDNALPEPIDRPISIQKGEWHRVIKGTTDLQIKVERK
jgi:hypothetical protein